MRFEKQNYFQSNFALDLNNDLEDIDWRHKKRGNVTNDLKNDPMIPGIRWFLMIKNKVNIQNIISVNRFPQCDFLTIPLGIKIFESEI